MILSYIEVEEILIDKIGGAKKTRALRVTII